MQIKCSDDVSRPLVSIIIPAFNEEAVIGTVIEKILSLELPDSELIVVNDGSTDNTALVAQSAGARVISHPYNIGNGAAVKTGIRSAAGRALVFMDGDGQHDPRLIVELVRGLADFHMVVGARGSESETSSVRDFGNWVFNTFSSFVAEFHIQDLTSGFRSMRYGDARRFCDILPNTFSYPTTSTLAFLRSGRTLKYVPIVAARRIGKSKIRVFRDGVEFLMIIVKIAMLFSPFRVFLPVSAFLFSLGLLRYVQTYILFYRFTNMSHLLINTSVIVFMLGLVAEQIATLRLEADASVLAIEDQQEFEVFRSYSNCQK